MKNIFLTSSVHAVAGDIATKVKPSNILFINTAAELDYNKKEEPQWIVDDRQALETVGFKLTNFTFSNKTLSDIQKAFTQVEGIYVEGGNTFYLLQQMQQANCLDYIKDIVEDGFIYIGTSAGSIVAGPDINFIRGMEDLSQAPKIKDTKGLKLTNMLLFPHWGSSHFEATYRAKVLVDAYQSIDPILVLRDNHYLHIFEEGFEVVNVS